jgi:hypothetical protein
MTLLKLKLKLISDISGTANAGDDTFEIKDNLPTVYLQNLPLGTTISEDRTERGE